MVKGKRSCFEYLPMNGKISTDFFQLNLRYFIEKIMPEELDRTA
jgi:hypothetical protein